MAVDTTQSWQEHTSDGSTAYFPFNFNYDTTRPGTIVVGKRTADNTYSVVDASNYELIPNASGDGGQIRFIQNPSGSQVIDDIPPAGTIVRIERVSVDTSSATWQIGLEMSELVNLFDRLFRLVQENKGGFDNVIKTFETQHNVSLYELLSAHNNHLLYWDNTTQTLTPTDFPKEDVVRCVNGLFFRISTTQAGVPYLEWSANGSSDWHSSSATWGTIDGNINNQTDLKNALDAKQNTISDLSTIRSGASKGATAVQPNDNITVLNNNAGYITASYHDATKQDLLVSGTNIKTINGRDILGSGDITISSSVAWGNVQGTLTDQTDLKNALDLKADNNAVVHLIGTETIAGDKTFSGTNYFTGTTNVPTPSNPNESSTHAANTQWVHNFAYSYVSNCITEIPQDIKLELNNGTLTVKAGTVYYVPNGAGVFTKQTLSVDETVTPGSANSEYFIFISNNGGTSRFVSYSVYSGATAPTVSGTAVWYDTTNNEVKYTSDSGSTWTGGWSLPIAVCTPQSGSWVSIDHIFNGFAYIGSTLFVLPGVKFLRMNGKNSDGTLKTILTTTSSVVVYINSNHQNGERHITAFDETSIVISSTQYSTQPANGYVTFDEVNNLSYSSLSISRIADLGTVTVSNYKITSFKPKTPFHAVDYNDATVKTGNNTLTGNNSFTGSNEFTQTVKAPSVYGYGSDGVRTASLEFIDGGNDNIARLVAVSNNGGNAATADLHFNNGSPYFSVPSSDVIGSAVATTGISKGQEGYVKLGNGIIIQWGYFDASTANQPITFPTAFTSASSYSLAFSLDSTVNTGGNVQDNCINTRTSTGFTTGAVTRTGNAMWIAIGY